MVLSSELTSQLLNTFIKNHIFANHTGLFHEIVSRCDHRSFFDILSNNVIEAHPVLKRLNFDYGTDNTARDAARLAADAKDREVFEFIRDNFFPSESAYGIGDSYLNSIVDFVSESDYNAYVVSDALERELAKRGEILFAPLGTDAVWWCTTISPENSPVIRAIAEEAHGIVTRSSSLPEVITGLAPVVEDWDDEEEEEEDEDYYEDEPEGSTSVGQRIAVAERPGFQPDRNGYVRFVPRRAAQFKLDSTDVPDNGFIPFSLRQVSATVL